MAIVAGRYMHGEHAALRLLSLTTTRLSVIHTMRSWVACCDRRHVVFMLVPLTLETLLGSAQKP